MIISLLDSILVYCFHATTDVGNTSDGRDGGCYALCRRTQSRIVEEASIVNLNHFEWNEALENQLYFKQKMVVFCTKSKLFSFNFKLDSIVNQVFASNFLLKLKLLSAMIGHSTDSDDGYKVGMSDFLFAGFLVRRDEI